MLILQLNMTKVLTIKEIVFFNFDWLKSSINLLVITIGFLTEKLIIFRTRTEIDL